MPDVQSSDSRGKVCQNTSARIMIRYEKELQEYIATVGNSLVPEYQKGLNSDDPRRLDFRFYVVDGENSPNAFCFPNGVIGINSAMLLMLARSAETLTS